MESMTEVLDVHAALAIIDAGLGDMTDRELVSTAEITDLLLDVRALLAVRAETEPTVGIDVEIDPELG